MLTASLLFSFQAEKLFPPKPALVLAISWIRGPRPPFPLRPRWSWRAPEPNPLSVGERSALRVPCLTLGPDKNPFSLITRAHTSENRSLRQLARRHPPPRKIAANWLSLPCYYHVITQRRLKRRGLHKVAQGSDTWLAWTHSRTFQFPLCGATHTRSTCTSC